MKRRRFWACLWAVLAVLAIPDPVWAQHPFLIVRATGYDALRARAAQTPWQQMKASAIADATNLSYLTTDTTEVKIRRMWEITGAASLAFILDPARRTTYKNKLRDTLGYWSDLYSQRNTGWDFAVPAGSAFFCSVLALDIIYNDLTPDERAAIESKLDAMAEWYWSTGLSWPMNTHGVRGVWALYQNDTARLNTAKASYRTEFASELTASHVFAAGPGYAGVRLGGNLSSPGSERDAKAHLMDVLEFTGADNTYYSDARFKGFYEWLYGYSASPFRRHYSFGDTDPTGFGIRNGARTFSAYRFSPQAARYAAWANNGSIPRGRLLPYVLAEQRLPGAERAPSKIFADGGAWFVDDTNSTEALAGVLWNCRSSEYHSHKDVNALHLCAYGEHVLENVGYAGAGTPALGYSWTYINNRAVSGNTVLLNYTFADDLNPPSANDHDDKSGAGIREGFVTPALDYASGDSGGALPNGKHWRNFVFVRPQETTNGYWVLFDEVDAEPSGASAHIALHPSSASYSTIAAAREYQWTIKRYGPQNVFLSLFLATPPASVLVRNGVRARFGDQSFVGKYLYSTYTTDAAGKRNMVTVLFPHDSDHPKAVMTRVAGTGYTGARVALNGVVVDQALESSGTTIVTHENVSFRGLATLYRRSPDKTDFYFVRRGRYFYDNAGHGFNSNADVSLYVQGRQGKLISPATDVTFYHPNLVGVLVNNQLAPIVAKSGGQVTVRVGAGTHDIALVLRRNPDFSPGVR